MNLESREHFMTRRLCEHANNMANEWSFQIPFDLTSAGIGER